MTAAAGLPRTAADLVPLLRRNAARGEQDRKVPEESIQAIAEAGLFAVAVPRRFGGHEAPLRTFMDVSAELGRGDGSTAWVTALMNVCSWMIGLFPEQAQRDVWDADPDARACGVLDPSAESRATSGGQVITGRWGFASGCLHSQWAVLGMPVTGTDGEQVDQGLALVPMSDLSIEDTWHVAGMRGTGSNTLVASEVFVPDHRILSVPSAIEGSYGTEHTGETLYRSALVPVLALILVGPQLGLAKGAFELVQESLAKGRPISYTFYEQSNAAPTTQLQMAEAAMLIDTAYLHAFRAADDIDGWAASGSYMDKLTRARVRMDTGYVARRCREAIDILLSVHGAGSFAEANALQRIWRDQEVGNRHAIVNPAINAEIYGRALLGIEEQVTPLV
ncbi:MAG: oxidoreductase [Pseudonocardiaceae bacterium]|nr:oxidoreductase [Pseudonocardiaceae bacterium]